MRWTRLANLIAALAIALGSHFVVADARVTALADVIAVIVAQNNRELTKPTHDRRAARRGAPLP